jgi:hypothetical protein
MLAAGFACLPLASALAEDIKIGLGRSLTMG